MEYLISSISYLISSKNVSIPKGVFYMKTVYKMLVINPGSTSTKVSYFENEKNVYTESVFHDAPELLSYPTVNDQIPLRRAFI